MIRAFASYIAEQIRPRGREIATEPEALFAVAAGIAAAIWLGCIELGDSKVGDVLTVVLAYAAVAFGFSVAGLTVALTLPNAEFVDKLANMDEEPSRSRRKRRPAGFRDNAYSRLLFVFSWTAVLHWGVIATGFAMLIVRGYDAKLMPDDACFGIRVLVGAVTFFLVYAAAQFLVTLVTLSQVGNAYISTLRTPRT